MENSRILSSFIPNEVLYEILRRLPAKSLSRCCCVSKTWNSLIRSPNFIATHHAAAAAAGNSRLFVQFMPGLCQSLNFDKHLLIDLKPLESGLNFLQPSRSSAPSSVFIHAYADGVLSGCVRLGDEFRHVLCNPAIHRYVVLPEPVSGSFPHLGLGFVPSKNDIGVVKISPVLGVEIGREFVFPPIVKVCYARERVWKTIAHDLAGTYLLSHRPDKHCCTNGRVHWVVRSRRENLGFLPCDSEHLLVFDFERERFETLDLPGELVKDLEPRLGGITLLLFEQNLSVLLHGSQRCSLWSLMAYPDVSSWAKLWSFDTVGEKLFTVFVGWRADYKLIVSRDKVGVMRAYDPDAGSSEESYEFPFNGMNADYVCGFDESLFLSEEEMKALPLAQMQANPPGLSLSRCGRGY